MVLLRRVALLPFSLKLPKLKPQEIPFDHPDSFNRFQASSEKPLLATPGAIDAYSMDAIVQCYLLLNHIARERNGIDYLQIFVDQEDQNEDLWFIEDGPGGAITALLRSEY